MKTTSFKFPDLHNVCTLPNLSKKCANMNIIETQRKLVYKKLVIVLKFCRQRLWKNSLRFRSMKQKTAEKQKRNFLQTPLMLKSCKNIKNHVVFNKNLTKHIHHVIKSVKHWEQSPQ
jgi:hypothetical protein